MSLPNPPDLLAITPLRKRTASGGLYTRPPKVELLLQELWKLPIETLVERARQADPADPSFLPSECLLHFLRRTSLEYHQVMYGKLFLSLRQRLLRAVPVRVKRLRATGKLAEHATDLEIRDAVLQNFHELLCGDRRVYEERLDFFECRFNLAVAKLRSTARRDVLNRVSKLVPLGPGEMSGQPSGEVERTLAQLRDPPNTPSDFLYRSKLLNAISELPTAERRVIELLIEEVPIESQDENALTISRVLRCQPQTVRNRRDRAFAKLRDALEGEGP